MVVFDFKPLFIHLHLFVHSQVGELLKRGGSSKCYSVLFHTALAPDCPGSCSRPFYYVILSSPVLITS